MNTVPVKEFVRHIAPMLEKCPDFVIEREVIKTVGDICRSSGCITTTSEVKTVAGEANYEFSVPRGLDTDILRYLYCDGVKLQPVTYDEVASRYPFDWRETRGTPRAYSFRQHEQLTLFPVPDKEYTLKADITVALKSDSKVVPEMFFHAYLDLVVNGTLARIHQLAGQPYSNTQLALGYQQLYASGVAQLKSEVFRDYTRTAGRVMFNRVV